MNIRDNNTLIRYLRMHHILQLDEPVSCEILAGGVSNDTVLVRRKAGPDLVVKQALSRLNVKTEWLSDPARIHIEAAALRILPGIITPGIVPAFVFEDTALHILVMEAIPQPHINWKKSLLRGQVDFDAVCSFGAMLGNLHLHSLNADHLARKFQNTSYFESLRLDPYYKHTAEKFPAAKPFLRNLIKETRSEKFCLVHGDFSPKNILLYNNCMVLLDHEVMHYGNGTFDVGFAMTHFLSKANHMPAKRAGFIDAARYFWQVYKHIFPVNRRLETLAVKQTLGCLLSRVAGKSPLEYLTTAEQNVQITSCMALLKCIPSSMSGLISAWEARL